MVNAVWMLIITQSMFTWKTTCEPMCLCLYVFELTTLLSIDTH